MDAAGGTDRAIGAARRVGACVQVGFAQRVRAPVRRARGRSTRDAGPPRRARGNTPHGRRRRVRAGPWAGHRGSRGYHPRGHLTRATRHGMRMPATPLPRACGARRGSCPVAWETLFLAERPESAAGPAGRFVLGSAVRMPAERCAIARGGRSRQTRHAVHHLGGGWLRDRSRGRKSRKGYRLPRRAATAHRLRIEHSQRPPWCHRL